MDLRAELRDIWDEMLFNHLGWKKLFKEDAFILLPIDTLCPLEIECLNGTWDFL
jgi:hypothetical protein